MKKENMKHLIIGTVICAATLLLFLVFNGQLPDNVPVQIDASGNVSNSLPKPLFLFGVPGIFVAANLFKNAPRLNQKEDVNVIKFYIIPIIAVLASVGILVFALSKA